MMSTSHRPPSPETKKRRRPPWVPEDAGLSKELKWLQDDLLVNPHPESTRPRQEPAMNRYHGAPPKPHPEPKKKRHHSRQSQKKAKGPNMPSESQEVPAPLKDPKAPGPLMEPGHIPFKWRRSVKMEEGEDVLNHATPGLLRCVTAWKN
ncbi:hypothetical protein EDB92DRAFT_2116983 [Lactarius akahatsu]|uniref:Uncharacterized protein n=1 Tax=Lactarius akahatsu TaxID=416441 RepID=A0AAD4QAK5_9AGAM|nr:hypothetical protein EDB92DRAFT_2116983 [Lactarius akahatsu]